MNKRLKILRTVLLIIALSVIAVPILLLIGIKIVTAIYPNFFIG